MADQSLTPTVQTPPPVTQLTQSEQDLIDSFKGTQIPTAQPLTGQAEARALSSPVGVLMYSAHCPVKDREDPRVSIFATSVGGHIRIYQNLP
jgi:hypothetical protein